VIGFDRPIRPPWIYESLRISQAGQKLSELNLPFKAIAKELTGKEGKRKARTVLFRIFLVDRGNKSRVKATQLRELSFKYDLEFMKPIYLFYLLAASEILLVISEHIFRLYDFGKPLNLRFLKEKIVHSFGERDVVKRAVGSFIDTLKHFGVVNNKDKSVILKHRFKLNEEQACIILRLWSKEILCSPQISLTHLPKKIFNYFEFPNLKQLAQKYNGVLWDYQHRVKEDSLVVW
jgi:hypothetical protein